MKIPAQRGVEAKLKPWLGSQIPWSQMIRMNISPPRPSEASRLARLPAAKARIRNRPMRNIGALTLVSIHTKATSSPTPPASAPSTAGLVQPMVCPP